MRHAVSRSNQYRFVAATLTGLVLALGGMPAVARADSSPVNCQEKTLAVALAPNTPADQQIRGAYCKRNGSTQVDILVHGATYNRTYWDWSVNPFQYSYAKKTLLAGRSTFAYDRLGAGSSSRPLSALITLNSEAYILHQINDWLRTTESFPQVNVVGHSYGSYIAGVEAAQYNDVNRLVLTGYLHADGEGVPEAVTSIYPALLDPQFALGGYDPGYLTTVPGARGSIFYSASANPLVVAYDEAHKDVVSATLFADGQALIHTPAALNSTNQILAPTMVVNGELDRLYCGLALNCTNHAAVTANEVPYYTNAASLTVKTVGSTGHNLALHPGASLSFLSINNWINTH